MDAREAERYVYVRERIQQIENYDSDGEYSSGVNLWGLNVPTRFHHQLQSDCWIAASKFVERREEEIKLKKEEILLIKQLDPITEAARRILAILKAQLADLQRGMKE